MREIEIKKSETYKVRTNKTKNKKQNLINHLNPVRYGDWEYKGRCIDF